MKGIRCGQTGFFGGVIDVVDGVVRMPFPVAWGTMIGIVEAVPDLDLNNDSQLLGRFEHGFETAPVFVVPGIQVILAVGPPRVGIHFVPVILAIAHGVADHIAAGRGQGLELLPHVGHLKNVVVIRPAQQHHGFAPILPVKRILGPGPNTGIIVRRLDPAAHTAAERRRDANQRNPGIHRSRLLVPRMFRAACEPKNGPMMLVFSSAISTAIRIRSTITPGRRPATKSRRKPSVSSAEHRADKKETGYRTHGGTPAGASFLHVFGNVFGIIVPSHISCKTSFTPKGNKLQASA